jgi:hypothetical protein
VLIIDRQLKTNSIEPSVMRSPEKQNLHASFIAYCLLALEWGLPIAYLPIALNGASIALCFSRILCLSKGEVGCNLVLFNGGCSEGV